METLRSALRLFVVLGLGLSTQSLLLLQTAFELRRDYIAEHLCVNRDQPELKCNGKCYLRAVSEGHVHGEDHTHGGVNPIPVSDRQVNLLELALSLVSFVPEKPTNHSKGASRSLYVTWHTSLHARNTGSEVFHPPRAV